MNWLTIVIVAIALLLLTYFSYAFTNHMVSAWDDQHTSADSVCGWVHNTSVMEITDSYEELWHRNLVADTYSNQCLHAQI